MANQTNPNKAKLQLWVDKSFVVQLDGIAAKKGVSRAAVVMDAVRQYIDDGDKAATKSDLVAFAATLQKAIESQPVVVQKQGTPPLLGQGRKLSLRERITGKTEKSG